MNQVLLNGVIPQVFTRLGERLTTISIPVLTLEALREVMPHLQGERLKLEVFSTSMAYSNDVDALRRFLDGVSAIHSVSVWMAWKGMSPRIHFLPLREQASSIVNNMGSAFFRKTGIIAADPLDIPLVSEIAAHTSIPWAAYVSGNLVGDPGSAPIVFGRRHLSIMGSTPQDSWGHARLLMCYSGEETGSETHAVINTINFNVFSRISA